MPNRIIAAETAVLVQSIQKVIGHWKRGAAARALTPEARADIIVSTIASIGVHEVDKVIPPDQKPQVVDRVAKTIVRVLTALQRMRDEISALNTAKAAKEHERAVVSRAAAEAPNLHRQLNEKNRAASLRELEQKARDAGA